MITVTNIRNINYAAYDQVWAIVRSLKNPRSMEHVPELSPSWSLFKRYLGLRNAGRWNAESFQNIYVPVFYRRCRIQQHEIRSQSLLIWTEIESMYAWHVFAQTKHCAIGALLLVFCSMQALQYMVLKMIIRSMVKSGATLHD